VKPIVPMPPTPILKPYRLSVIERPDSSGITPRYQYVNRPVAPTTPRRVVVSNSTIGMGPGGMGTSELPPTTTAAASTG
jgi:hypothetical protein